MAYSMRDKVRMADSAVLRQVAMILKRKDKMGPWDHKKLQMVVEELGSRSE